MARLLLATLAFGAAYSASAVNPNRNPDAAGFLQAQAACESGICPPGRVLPPGGPPRPSTTAAPGSTTATTTTTTEAKLDPAEGYKLMGEYTLFTWQDTLFPMVKDGKVVGKSITAEDTTYDDFLMTAPFKYYYKSPEEKEYRWRFQAQSGEWIGHKKNLQVVEAFTVDQLMNDTNINIDWEMTATYSYDDERSYHRLTSWFTMTDEGKRVLNARKEQWDLTTFTEMSYECDENRSFHNVFHVKNFTQVADARASVSILCKENFSFLSFVPDYSETYYPEKMVALEPHTKFGIQMTNNPAARGDSAAHAFFMSNQYSPEYFRTERFRVKNATVPGHHTGNVLHAAVDKDDEYKEEDLAYFVFETETYKDGWAKMYVEDNIDFENVKDNNYLVSSYSESPDALVPQTCFADGPKDRREDRDLFSIMLLPFDYKAWFGLDRQWG